MNSDDWYGFGYSVSISGDNAIVGAYADYGSSNLTGAAYLISNDGTSINQENIINFNKRDFNNFPNPFNPATTISFNLDTESNVSIAVYNVKGQKVTTLVDKHFENGSHTVTWNGKDSNNKSVSSGIYFYKISAGKSSAMKKMLLLK
ncbi:MAG: T9SS type A sorting domain-containing protein [Candidatus Cloacimonetes bacterium]|nr:T9SS type A sorting domain-containing protein [Candidatus Cloacimonadota bacterium]